MTIDFKAVRKELDKLEKLQSEAQKEISSPEVKVQTSGKLKQAAVFSALAESYKIAFPQYENASMMFIRGVLCSITK